MKNFHFKILALGIIAITLFNACGLNCIKGSGASATDNRKVTAFTKISLSGGYTVNLKQDSSYGLSITADDNLMKYIITEVSGDKLTIKSKKSFCSGNDVVINIGIGQLEELKASGAVELNSEGKLTVKNLNLTFSGAAKVKLDLNADRVTTKGSGATDLTLTGQASRHAVKLTGSGNINALDFVVGTYDLETTGASDCKINVLNELNVHSTGAANVQYKGNPTVNSHKTGAADIKKID